MSDDGLYVIYALHLQVSRADRLAVRDRYARDGIGQEELDAKMRDLGAG